MTPLDFRSDTLTQPCGDMRRVMAQAPVGDSFYGEDPSVSALEMAVAKLFGHEAALFVPSGTMSNQIAVQLHCRPGEAVIAAPDLHLLRAESGALAALAGVQAVCPAITEDFLPNTDKLNDVFVGADSLVAPATTLMVVENTHLWSGGQIHPKEHLAAISAWCKDHRVALHLDGARLWHAHVETGVALTEFGSLFDSISVCFSKGLGAPVGSCLVSSKTKIRRAQLLRKRLGGTMRQAGHLAAAAHWALANNLSRLKDDHTLALQLADWLKERIDGVHIERPQTNIVLLKFAEPALHLIPKLERNHAIRLSALNSQTLRAVCHKDICRERFDALIRS